jgi:hypothetical protein
VVAESLHLAAVVALGARVEQQVPAYAWPGLVAVLVVGLGSVVAVLLQLSPSPPRRRDDVGAGA